MAASKIAAMILAILSEGEKHGYELLREMEERGLLRWSRVSRVSVYKNLARLEGQGCLTSWREKDGNMPERVVYGITTEGENRLREMLFDLCSSREPLRMDYAVGAAFIHLLGKEEALEALGQRREFLRAQLKRLTREREMLEGVGGGTMDTVREREIAAYREELRWLERVASDVEANGLARRASTRHRSVNIGEEKAARRRRLEERRKDQEDTG